MKKLLTAFTLAEVLITLGIVGVIARVTLPALMSNVGKQQAATTLLKGINTLETANRTVLANKYAQSLNIALNEGSDAEAINANDYLRNIASYINGEVRVESKFAGIENIPILTTKDGISFYADGPSGVGPIEVKEGTSSFPEQYKGLYFRLIIDTNGYKAKPNKLGEDRFLVIVDEYGAVIPIGSMLHQIYNNNQFEEAKTKAIPSPWTDATKGCNEKVCSDNTSGKGYGTPYAAGSIVENGGKIIYKITREKDSKK